ncbi:MAG: CCA tRNA nucleotidyltransferase [Richelia sp. RM2_1_2]|nr:CCA tRNA nucleotidyltransferase [Richelia sp. RM2_1_2]
MLIEDLDSVKRKVDLKQLITPDIKQLVIAFDKHGYDLRIVGGAVRDLVLGKQPKDVDFATDATPDEMKTIFDAEGIKWIATGEKHGTLTALGPSTREPFEITTLRIDTEQDGRHANVSFTRSWEDDAKRRDLTYNAMSIDLKNGNLHDYFHGLDDLEAGRTQFVGDATARMQEDFLRILRLFRFSARYNHPIDSETRKAIKQNASNLKNISGERIWMEVSKILAGPNADVALKTMNETGVSAEIGLPIRDLKTLNDVKTRTSNPITLLSTQLIDGNEVDAIRARWKLANPERDLAVFLVENKYAKLDNEKLQNMIVNGAKKEFVSELSKLVGLKFDANKWNAPLFPVTGNDLISAGFKPGPELGKTLNILKQKWIESRYSLTKIDLLGYLNRLQNKTN